MARVTKDQLNNRKKWLEKKVGIRLMFTQAYGGYALVPYKWAKKPDMGKGLFVTEAGETVPDFRGHVPAKEMLNTINDGTAFFEFKKKVKGKTSKKAGNYVSDSVDIKAEEKKTTDRYIRRNKKQLTQRNLDRNK